MSELLDLLAQDDYTPPNLVEHAAAKFLSGATGGLLEAAARRFGVDTPFHPTDRASEIAGTVGDIAGFTVGIPGKVLGPVSKLKSASTMGKVAEGFTKQGTFGAVYGGGQAAVAGEDISEAVLDEAPFWAAFGAISPLVGAAFRRVFPKVEKGVEAAMGVGDEIPPKLKLSPVGREVKVANALNVPRIATTREFTESPTATRATRELFDSFGRKVEVRNFLEEGKALVERGSADAPRFTLSPNEILKKRAAGEPLSILFDSTGRPVGATPTANITYTPPSFQTRTYKTQAELIRSRQKAVEEMKATLFPKKPIGARLARARIIGKPTEVSALADDIRSLQDDLTVVTAAKKAGRLPASLELTSIAPNTLYDVGIMGTNDIVRNFTLPGSKLKSILGDPRFKITGVQPKVDAAGMMDLTTFSGAYENLGLPPQDIPYIKERIKSVGRLESVKYTESSTAPVKLKAAIRLKARGNKVITGETHPTALNTYVKRVQAQIAARPGGSLIPEDKIIEGLGEIESGYVNKEGKFISQESLKNMFSPEPKKLSLEERLKILKERAAKRREKG